jgi:eukaryotic-like serine/threonine-protein kinase
MAVPPGNRWHRIEELFYAAMDMAPTDRSPFLDQACAGDPSLRNEVQSLLDASDKTLSFLEKPVQEAARGASDKVIEGRQVGPYRLLRVLGEGGMGRVYLASRADDLYDQQVAIKLMHAGFAQTQRMLLRFGAERQILANLNHPNIARLLDGGVHEGVPYLVMEYVNGVPIDQYCKTNKLPTEARLRLFSSVCDAVEFAHKNLVVHRDIKPSNILVNAEGSPKLLDFGIAKLLAPDGSESLQTRTTERMMTPEYASPEQVRGENITTSTDVYALGVLLYALLSGKRPFHLGTSTPFEVVRMICEQTPTAPSQVWQSAPELAPPDAARKLKGELDNIVMMAMRKEPARRYVSVGQLSEDVVAFLNGYPIRARTDTWSYRSGKFIQRHKAAVVAAAVVGVALVAFGIGMALLARKEQSERQSAEREAQFLNSIFQATTPEQARGKQITGRELLDEGAKRVEAEFSGEPKLQATLFGNIGHAYLGLGLYDKAEPLMQRAYDLRRQTLGESNLETAAALGSLASSIRLKGEYQRAEPLFRKALAIRETKLPPTDARVGEIKTALGECLYLLEKNEEAEAVLRPALEIQRKQHQDDLVSSTDNYLALVLERKGAFGEAAQLLRESLDITVRINGPDSPDTAISLHNLAGTLIDAGDLSGAEKVDRQVLEIRRKINGPGHPDLSYPLNNLGFIFLEKGDWAAAGPLLKENLEVRGGPNKKEATAAGALNNWARMLQEKGDYKAADESYRQAIETMRELKGAESWALAKMLANQGFLRADERNYAEAEQLERQALMMREKLGGEETPDLAASQINLALILSFEHDYAGAEPLLRRALEIRQKELSSGHPAVIVAKVRLGEVLVDAGKAAEAEPLLRSAVTEIHAVPFPVTTWQVAEAEIALGAALAANGHRAEADRLLRDPEARLKGYPEAAVLRKILSRARTVKSGKA